MLIVSGMDEGTRHERPSHPERPGRITAAIAGIEDLHLEDDLRLIPAYSASRAELTRVHTSTYLDELASFSESGGGDLDPDTYVTRDSWTIACNAAGAGIAAVNELRLLGEGVAFVAARPPGHHALRDRGLGFCLLNNIAVTAASLTAQGERVLIIDWDVHHGNGTQAIFWDDPNVLYVSTHQWPLFPGSGQTNEIGGKRASGLTVNAPVPAGATGDVVRQAFGELAAPVIDDFDPTWILVSAGFDAHRDDPLADLALTTGDFAELGRWASSLVPRPGRLALFLEGGYDAEALRRSVAATLGAILDADYQSEPASAGGPGSEMVHRAQFERLSAIRLAARDSPEESQ